MLLLDAVVDLLRAAALDASHVFVWIIMRITSCKAEYMVLLQDFRLKPADLYAY